MSGSCVEAELVLSASTYCSKIRNLSSIVSILSFNAFLYGRLHLKLPTGGVVIVDKQNKTITDPYINICIYEMILSFIYFV